MRLIPVIDVQNAQVVHGIGGRRKEYRPIVSALTSRIDPVGVADALIAAFRPSEIYVADLDAIAGREPSWKPLADARLPVRFWIDAGIERLDDIKPLLHANVSGIVLGLETIAGPEILDHATMHAGADRIVFSLDLRNGRMLGRWQNFSARDDGDWRSVVRQVVRCGLRRLILLDLARVGEGAGVGTEAICREITSTHPKLEVICGGGVRDLADSKRLEECGAAAALVASALHDGRIKPFFPERQG